MYLFFIQALFYVIETNNLLKYTLCCINKSFLSCILAVLKLYTVKVTHFSIDLHLIIFKPDHWSVCILIPHTI